MSAAPILAPDSIRAITGLPPKRHAPRAARMCVRARLPISPKLLALLLRPLALAPAVAFPAARSSFSSSSRDSAMICATARAHACARESVRVRAPCAPRAGRAQAAAGPRRCRPARRCAAAISRASGWPRSPRPSGSAAMLCTPRRSGRASPPARAATACARARSPRHACTEARALRAPTWDQFRRRCGPVPAPTWDLLPEFERLRRLLLRAKPLVVARGKPHLRVCCVCACLCVWACACACVLRVRARARARAFVCPGGSVPPPGRARPRPSAGSA
jgi:hypothetical protein